MPARRLLSIALLAIGLSSCFMLARERDLSGTWTGTMVIDGEPFDLAAQLRHVDGRLEGPVVAAGANATLTIFLRNGEAVTLTGRYEGHGCAGTLEGAGTLRGDQLIEGSVTVEDTCSGRGTGTFELRREGEADGMPRGGAGAERAAAPAPARG